MNRPIRSLDVLGLLAATLPVACTAQPPAGGGSATAAPAAAATQTLPVTPIVSGLPDFTGLVEQVGPAVVNIREQGLDRAIEKTEPLNKHL